MGEPSEKTLVSVEDYLEGEKTAEVRHELVCGEVFAMVGTTKAHNLIAGNLYGLLRRALAQLPCRVFMSDVKVHVKHGLKDWFFYPDLHVECEPYTPNSYYSEHPRLVVEILSDSTERNDRSEKFYTYRKLESLEEYLLVAQDERRVEVYRRGSGWDLEIFRAGEAFRLDGLGVEISLASLYDAVELPGPAGGTAETG